MSKAYFYVVDRDFGFAPNPFHGRCTLATCKPGIRLRAEIGDWIVGMGGRRLSATGRCVFAMEVTTTLSFDLYWADPIFRDKRPVRNGSRRMMVGDNIYHRDLSKGQWQQADSHHSNPDGTPNPHNVANDTQADRVLISDYFYYFGQSAPVVPDTLLGHLGFKNGRNYRVFDGTLFSPFLDWLRDGFRHARNTVSAAPFDFESSDKRYSAGDNRIT